MAIKLSRFQPDLPLDRLILERDPGDDAVAMDVLFVGAGPAGLAGAIELARLARADGGVGSPLEIGVLEKASALGEHCLSGAVLDPGPLRELFPALSDADLPFRGEAGAEAFYFLTPGTAVRLPTPPSMRNRGNRMVSICELVRWMGERAEELGVNIFTGYPVDALLVSGSAVRGVRTTPAGLGRGGEPSPSYVPPLDLSASVTVLAEGTRGWLTQAWTRWQGVSSTNPQTYALGVKELWEVGSPLDRVIHTMGWPLPSDTFGGSWIYPMGESLVSIGLVVGLDSPHGRLDVHGLLQALKSHPLVRSILKGGEMVEWGAKTIPEGGYHSVLERRHGEGLLLIGDAAGYVDVPSLKGIHYAMHSGVLAARAAFGALEAADATESMLRRYTEAIDRSFIMEDLRRSRNMRSSFRSGLVRGAIRAATMQLTGGRFPAGVVEHGEDAEVPKDLANLLLATVRDGTATFSKLEAVYRSGNRTRDDIPNHLLTSGDVPPEVAEIYAHLCPAGVYESLDGHLVVNAPNCIDCKATDVLGPRWTPREGGSGPRYRRM